MKNTIQSEAPATVSARKAHRSPTPISVTLVAKVTLELGRTENGTYSHARFEPPKTASVICRVENRPSASGVAELFASDLRKVCDVKTNSIPARSTLHRNAAFGTFDLLTRGINGSIHIRKPTKIENLATPSAHVSY